MACVLCVKVRELYVYTGTEGAGSRLLARSSHGRLYTTPTHSLSHAAVLVDHVPYVCVRRVRHLAQASTRR